MRSRTVIVWLTGVAIVCIMAAFPRPARAERRAFARETIHMGVAGKGNATDLHFTLWQKEDNIEILGWDYALWQIVPGKPSVKIKEDKGNRGIDDDKDFRKDPRNQATWPGMSDNGKDHRAQVAVSGLDVPFCTWFWLETSLDLTTWNDVHIRDVNWTFDAAPDPQPPGDEGLPPDEGFTFTDYMLDPIHPGKFKVVYTFWNDDPDKWIRVSDLAFQLDRVGKPADDPDELWNWGGWVSLPTTSFDLAPRTHLEFVLDDLTKVDWLHAKMVKQELSGEGGVLVGDDYWVTQSHETPEGSTFLAFGMLLAGLALGHLRSRNQRDSSKRRT
jgi:hypothetical protein